MPKLQPAQAVHAAESMISRIDKIRDGNADLFASDAEEIPQLTGGLLQLSSRMTRQQAAHLADSLTEIAAKPHAAIPSGLVGGFSAALPGMDDAQVNRVVEALIAKLPNQAAMESLQGMAPRIQPPQAMRAWATVIRNVTSTHPPNSMSGLPDSAPDVLQATCLPPGTTASPERGRPFDRCAGTTGGQCRARKGTGRLGHARAEVKWSAGRPRRGRGRKALGKDVTRRTG